MQEGATACKIAKNRLKIRREKSHGGSSPPPGTIESSIYRLPALCHHLRLWLNYGRTQKVCVRGHPELQCLKSFHPKIPTVVRRVICTGNKLQSTGCRKSLCYLSRLTEAEFNVDVGTSQSGSTFRFKASLSPPFSHPHSEKCVKRFDRNKIQLHDPTTRSLLAMSASVCPCHQKEKLVMATAPTMTRRLLRTKQAATYLSMSEWKLRRLIQDSIIPFIQDHEGGPFLLDVRDLDAYIESNKHHPDDSDCWRPNAVALVSSSHVLHPVRRAK